MAASIDLALDDQGHIGTQESKRLGTRLADLAIRDLFPGPAMLTPTRKVRRFIARRALPLQ